MCFGNGSEPELGFLDWQRMFPNGFPPIDTNGLPRIEELLLSGKKGKEKKSMLREIYRDAYDAWKNDFSLKRAICPLFDSLRRKNEPS